MATQLKNTTSSDLGSNKLFKKFRIGIVVADWNKGITHAMLNGAMAFLIENGIKEKNITVKPVPGSFELPLGAQFLAINKNIDAVIALGCIIQGETRHFDFISDACAQGVMDVSLTFNKPVGFGVLTTNDEKQAKERAGGKLGNKGAEAAETVLKMLLLKTELS